MTRLEVLNFITAAFQIVILAIVVYAVWLRRKIAASQVKINDCQIGINKEVHARICELEKLRLDRTPEWKR